MIKYLNFKKYTPKNSIYEGVLYFQCNGKDWYDIRDSLSPSSIKCIVSPDGYVACADKRSHVIGMIDGFSLYVFDEVPEDFDYLKDTWKIVDDKLVKQ